MSMDVLRREESLQLAFGMCGGIAGNFTRTWEKLSQSFLGMPTNLPRDGGMKGAGTGNGHRCVSPARADMAQKATLPASRGREGGGCGCGKGKQRASVSGHSATVAADTHGGGAHEISYCALNLCDIILQCPVAVDCRSRRLRLEWTAGRASSFFFPPFSLLLCCLYYSLGSE